MGSRAEPPSLHYNLTQTPVNNDESLLLNVDGNYVASPRYITAAERQRERQREQQRRLKERKSAERMRERRERNAMVPAKRRFTPRSKPISSSIQYIPEFTSNSGEKYFVRKDNVYINNMGKRLGSGKTSVVIADANDDMVAYKIYKNSAVMGDEIQKHQLATMIKAAPEIYGVDDNVVQMQRIYMLNVFPSDDKQRQLVKLVARMVSIGMLHNNLHLNHIGYLRDGTMTLIDFEMTQIVKSPIINTTLFLQVVMAQLYALIDPCNSNNKLDVMICDKSYIVDCINAIKKHKENDPIVAELLAIREDTIATFNSLTV
jgi:hypothetical protein